MSLMTSGRDLTRYSGQSCNTAPPRSSAVRVPLLQHGAHGAVEDEDAGSEGVVERLLALGEGSHGFRGGMPL